MLTTEGERMAEAVLHAAYPVRCVACRARFYLGEHSNGDVVLHLVKHPAGPYTCRACRKKVQDAADAPLESA